MTVFAVGTINADFVLPLPGELEQGASLVSERLLRTSGGRAGNAAVMARRMQAPVRLFGCVGDDVLADQALAGPRSADVDVHGVRVATAGTGVAAVLVSTSGEKTMIVAPGANREFDADDGERLGAELADASDPVLAMDCELPIEALAPALDAARRRDAPVVLDPTRPERVTDELLAQAHTVTPNAHEASQLTGVDVQTPADGRRAAELLRACGVRRAFVKLPAGGCAAAWEGDEAILLAPAVADVVDTTGAGDAFMGAVAAGTLTHLPPRETAIQAVAAATCAVRRLGAQPSYPHHDTLTRMAGGVHSAG